MTNKQKIELRLSEVRTRLNEISGLEGDDLSDEVRAESASLQTEFADLETRHRAAIVAEGEQSTETRQEETEDTEERERRELREKSTLAAYFSAAMKGQPVSGREAELSEAYGCPGSVPLEMFRTERRERDEQRAVTPGVGANDAQQNLSSIVPAIFDRSAAAWLGIEMPTVGTGGRGLSGFEYQRHGRTQGEIGGSRRDGGGVHRHHGATPKDHRGVPFHAGRRGTAFRDGRRASHEYFERPER